MELSGTELVFPHLDLRSFTHDELLLASQLTAPGDVASWTWPPVQPPDARSGFVLSPSSVKQTCSLDTKVHNKAVNRAADSKAHMAGMADPLAMLADASLHITAEEGGKLRGKTGSASDLLEESLLMLSQRGVYPPAKKSRSGTAPGTPSLSQEEQLIASLHNALAKDRHQHETTSESKPDSLRRQKARPKNHPSKGIPAPDMPAGWLLDVRFRESGNRVDKVWTSPEGVQLRSIKECESYLLGKARKQPVQPVPKGKFGCPSCGLRFGNTLDLGNHVTVHLEPVPGNVKVEEDLEGDSQYGGSRSEKMADEPVLKMEDCPGEGEGHVSGRTARWLHRVGLWKGPEAVSEAVFEQAEGLERNEKALQRARHNFEALLHDPSSWYGLDLLTTNEALAVEHLIAEHGRVRARSTLLQQKHRITADLIDQLYRPILSVLLLILEGTNDIKEGKLGILVLKRRVCRALGLKRRGEDPQSPDTPSPPESPPLGAVSEDDVIRRDVGRPATLAPWESERPKRTHREAALALPAPDRPCSDGKAIPPLKEGCCFGTRGRAMFPPRKGESFPSDASGRQRDASQQLSDLVEQRHAEDEATMSGHENPPEGGIKRKADVVESAPPRVTRKRTRVDTIWPEALTAQLMSAHAHVPATIESQMAAMNPGSNGGQEDARSPVNSRPPGKLRWLVSRPVPVTAAVSESLPVSERPTGGQSPPCSVGAMQPPMQPTTAEIQAAKEPTSSSGGVGASSPEQAPKSKEQNGGNEIGNCGGQKVGAERVEDLRARARACRSKAQELRKEMETNLKLADELETDAAALEAKWHAQTATLDAAIQRADPASDAVRANTEAADMDSGVVRADVGGGQEKADAFLVSAGSSRTSSDAAVEATMGGLGGKGAACQATHQVHKDANGSAIRGAREEERSGAAAKQEATADAARQSSESAQRKDLSLSHSIRPASNEEGALEGSGHRHQEASLWKGRMDTGCAEAPSHHLGTGTPQGRASLAVGL